MSMFFTNFSYPLVSKGILSHAIFLHIYRRPWQLAKEKALSNLSDEGLCSLLLNYLILSSLVSSFGKLSLVPL